MTRYLLAAAGLALLMPLTACGGEMGSSYYAEPYGYHSYYGPYYSDHVYYRNYNNDRWGWGY